MYKHLIVARAQWNVSKQPQWSSASAMVEELRERVALPQLIALVDGDNELLLDLNAEPCRQILFTELTKRISVRLVEWLGTPDQCWLTRAGQHYSSELVIPFCLPQPPPLPTSSPFRPPSSIQRAYLPGSEWFYVKVYVGEQTANELLGQVITPLIKKAVHNQWIDHWFFIRYYDPEPHLRLRFHCAEDSYHCVLAELNVGLESWLVTGQVHTVQVDTYEREMERYGHQTIAHVERLFWVDSEWNLQWIANSAELNEDIQWWVACERADALIAAFGLSVSDKHELTTVLQARFLNENSSNSQLRKQLNGQYREWLIRIEDQTTPVLELSSSRPLVEEIQRQRAVNGVEQPFTTDLLTSLLHMQFNRFFVSDQRMCETVGRCRCGLSLPAPSLCISVK